MPLLGKLGATTWASFDYAEAQMDDIPWMLFWCRSARDCHGQHNAFGSIQVPAICQRPTGLIEEGVVDIIH